MSTIIEVDVPGIQGPAGPTGSGADPSAIRGGSLPPDFNVGAAYFPGSRVTRLGLEYICVTNPIIGDFTPDNWQIVSTQNNSLRIDELLNRVSALEG